MDDVRRLKGAWDIHVHANPSLFPRWGDAHDLALACRESGMAGFVLKFHHGSSIEVARTLGPLFPELKIHGGVTLNHFVGGINPYAVDSAMSLGAKVVWLPTLHAVQHGIACGCLGGFTFQMPSTRLLPKQGICILSEQGALIEPLREILSLMNGQSVVLATGHISPEEIFALQKYILKQGLKIPLLINHVCFKTPALSVEQLRELAHPGTWFETVYLSVSAMTHAATPAHVAGLIKAVPEGRWILASDSGQKGNLRSPEAILKFISLLESEGISAAQIQRMIQTEPEAVLAGI